MKYALCLMYHVLCTMGPCAMYYVLCTVGCVLCILYYILEMIEILELLQILEIFETKFMRLGYGVGCRWDYRKGSDLG